MKLSDASAIKVGSAAASKVYLGSTQVWPPGTTTFDPRSIPGLVAWYSAQAETGYANGQAMTGWTDLSGNGNHAVAANAGGGSGPLWQSTTGPSGGPAVRFQSASNGGYFILPDNLLSGASAGEIVVRIKSDNVNCGSWSLGARGLNDQSHYPFSGTVYEGFGLPTGTRRSFTPGTETITAWRRYDVWSAASDFAASLDGVSKVIYTGAFTPAFPTTNIWLGRGLGGSTNFPFQGHMTTVALYARKLTTTERADLAAWMTAHPSGGLA